MFAFCYLLLKLSQVTKINSHSPSNVCLRCVDAGGAMIVVVDVAFAKIPDMLCKG